MIHNTYLIRISTREVLAFGRYWPVDVTQDTLDEYLNTREDLRHGVEEDGKLEDLALIVGDHKFHGVDLLSDLLLIFVTDKGEDESSIFEKVHAASKILKKELGKSGLDSIVERYEKIIEPSITTRLKIALVGEGGVGKTTTLHLLLGDTPPLQYVPTIALNLETVENIRFGNYSLVLWDFAGQERFRTLWRFYFHGADVIFLVCDSALRNVIISKDILKLIKRDAPKVPVFALANKQDKPNAMKPEVIQKILGIPTYPMVAIDKSRRDEMLRILMTAAAQYVGVALPDLPASELLKFTDAATEEAIAETDAIEERRLAAEAEESEYETIEVIEEVLVDEEGHVIENLDDYEIVEEVIEEVEEDLFEEAEEEEEAVGEKDVVEEEVVPEAIEEQPTVIEPMLDEPVQSIDIIPEEEEIAISEPESVEEPQLIHAEVSDEHILHQEIESVEEDAFKDAAARIMAMDDTSLRDMTSYQEEEFEPTLVEDSEITSAFGEVAIEIEDEEPIESFGFTVPELPPEEVLEQEPVLEDNNGDVKLAKEIIFEALEADEFISAELGGITHSEIDEALDAMKSDETVCVDGEAEFPQEIDMESLEELESILGPLDTAVGGTKHDESSDEDTSHLPIDNESLDELSRLLDFVDSDDDDEE